MLACTGGQRDQSAGTINQSFTVSGVHLEPDSLNAYLAAHRGFTSRGGEMRCAYRPLGQRETKVFVWAVCEELLAADGSLVDGSAMSLPAAYEIAVDSGRPRIVSVEVPEDGSNYGRSIQRIFPSNTWPAIFANGGPKSPAAGLDSSIRREAAARFGLPAAAATAPRRYDRPSDTQTRPRGRR